ncbi:hypothetical protein Ancab_006098 [Ancistrocladus abbreviatus]
MLMIKQMEAYFKQVTEEHVELLTASESAQKLVDELRLRVMELEKELGQQRTVISERGRGKAGGNSTALFVIGALQMWVP